LGKLEEMLLTHIAESRPETWILFFQCSGGAVTRSKELLQQFWDIIHDNIDDLPGVLIDSKPFGKDLLFLPLLSKIN
jgi:hypothetical protein